MSYAFRRDLIPKTVARNEKINSHDIIVAKRNNTMRSVIILANTASLECHMPFEGIQFQKQ